MRGVYADDDATIIMPTNDIKIITKGPQNLERQAALQAKAKKDKKLNRRGADAVGFFF